MDLQDLKLSDENFQEKMDEEIRKLKLKHGQDIAKFYYVRALAFLIEFKYDDALYNIKKAIENNPNNPKYRFEEEKILKNINKKD